jgi:hypothetical protein
MNASHLSYHNTLSEQGISHQSQYLPIRLIMKASMTLVSVRKLICENEFTDIQVVAHIVSYVIYNLYFHPLRSYRRPFWVRASLLWRV